MTAPTEGYREGSLEAPTRHPIDWKNPAFYEQDLLFKEMERVFDICHGCRRCVSLCQAFPTLFDLIDNSKSTEIDGVAKSDYWKVAEQCYLCDLCYMTKCPYVPPHPWNVDFPHLMLRAKATAFAQGRSSRRDRLLSATDQVGRIAGIPVIAEAVNAINRSVPARKLLERTLGIHRDARLPEFHSDGLRKRAKRRQPPALAPIAAGGTQGRVILFATCYGERNEPQIGMDLIAVFEHNGIPVQFADGERCCGMPKLELGDLAAVESNKDRNIPELAHWAREGWDIVASVPSCVVMFKQELPLLFPEDPDVKAVALAFFDPFEYLSLRRKAGRLKTDFQRPLGRVVYHAACHQRVQNIGPRTREVLQLIPDTRIETIERCSGHDGTYAVKRECHDVAMKIGRPVMRRLEDGEASYITSDCALAGHHIEHGAQDRVPFRHPVSLLREAYGI
ncbi:MAG: heterodisulfide reductase-related iron-sulfur binding cluster [Gammaproteobacteria bacterium]